MDSSSTHGISAVIQELGDAESKVTASLDFAKKLKEKLTKAKQDVGKGKATTKLAALISDLRAMPPSPSAVPDVARLTDSLERHLRALGESYGASFKAELRRHCENAKLPLKPLGEGFAVGPFALSIDAAKETAALSYAKVPVAKDLPIDAGQIVKAVATLAERLLRPPENLKALIAQLDESMRVVLARQKKPAGRTELRVELPPVFREMAFIRSGLVTSSAKGEYSIPRFVVEVKTLVQSEENVKGDRRFRLETAVLDNAKDNRKSIFFPNDLNAGFGEGMYFQAIATTEG